MLIAVVYVDLCTDLCLLGRYLITQGMKSEHIGNDVKYIAVNTTAIGLQLANISSMRLQLVIFDICSSSIHWICIKFVFQLM